MDAPITILGGTGFIGRQFVQRCPSEMRHRLRLLVHRSRPDWIESCGVDLQPVDLADDRSFSDALSGSGVVINLLRPHGDGCWLPGVVERFVAIVGRTPVKRYIHCSSIDVYGGSSSRWVTEDTPLDPQNDYEREHAAAETAALAAPIDAVILRLGAVFGPGGRNVVAFIKEAQSAPAWKLAVRRALYGRRRMHLVSVEKVADALTFFARREGSLEHQCFLVTDDDEPDNNFAILQDLLMQACGRAPLAWVPELPSAALRLLLVLRGVSSVDPMRRFATERIRSAGFVSSAEFRRQLERYAEMAVRE